MANLSAEEDMPNAKSIKVVVGANYGDEGKGQMANYFCQQFPSSSNVLNIRYNGGAQAGHTVVMKDGRKHVFQHFGSGSFNPNVTTCLGPHFILNPILFRREWEKLASMGVDLRGRMPLVYLYSAITFPMDMIINQAIEKARGDEKHGSCGIGINETVERQQKLLGYLGLHEFMGLSTQRIVSKIKNSLVLWEYYDTRLKTLGLTLSQEQDKWFFNSDILYSYASDLSFMIDHTLRYSRTGLSELGNGLTSPGRTTPFQDYDHLVFEGAQGLLLDMDNGVHTTPSHPGLENLAPWFNDACISSVKDIEICYVTRTYFTRHGAGPFKTECDVSKINPDIVDKTNVTNEYQGGFRYGYFDKETFRNAIFGPHTITDLPNGYHGGKITTVALMHLNETGYRIPCSETENMTIAEMEEWLLYLKRGNPIRLMYISDSETDVNVLKDLPSDW